MDIEVIKGITFMVNDSYKYVKTKNLASYISLNCMYKDIDKNEKNFIMVTTKYANKNIMNNSDIINKIKTNGQLTCNLAFSFFIGLLPFL